MRSPFQSVVAQVLAMLFVAGSAPPAAAGSSPVPGPGKLVLQAAPYESGLSIDPSGRLLASASANMVAVYSLPTRALVAQHELAFPADRVTFVVGGRYLLAESLRSSTLISPATGEELLEIRGGSATAGWATVSLSRRSPHGFGIKLGDSGWRLAHLDVLEYPGQAVTLVEGTGWPLPDGCRSVTVNDIGDAAAVWCPDGIRVIAPGGERPVLFPCSADSAWPGREAWLSSDGTLLATVLDGTPVTIGFMDLRSGHPTTIELPPAIKRASARIRTILGLYGKEPELRVLAGGRLLSVHPRKGIVWQTDADEGISAAFDEVRQVYVLSVPGALHLIDPSGMRVGRIGGEVRPIVKLVRDHGTDRLFALVPDGPFRFSVKEVDLAEGEVRSVVVDGSLPAALFDLSTFRDRLRIVDPRGVGANDIPIEGVEPDSLSWGTRVSADRALVAGPERLGLVNLANRRFQGWIARRVEPRPTFATLLPFTGELLLLLADGTLETWDPTFARLTKRQATTWQTDGGRGAPLRAVAQLPGGSVLFGALDGLFEASLPGAAITTVSPGAVVDAIEVAGDGKLVAVAMGTMTALCPVITGRMHAPRCSTAVGQSPVFLRGGAELAIRTLAGGIAIFRVSEGKRVADVLLGAADTYLFTTPGQRYKASPGGQDLAVIARGTRARHLEEVGVQMSSPSQVLLALGRVRPERVRDYRALEEARRVRNSMFDPLTDEGGDSQVELLGTPPVWTARSSLAVRLRVHVGSHPPLRLVARINGVPIDGRRGRILSTSGSRLGESVEERLELPVGPGENRVVVTVVDAKGREAFGESFVVTGTGERTRGRVFYLGVGVSRYPDPARRLKYAAQDVSDVVAAIRRLEGPGMREKLLLDQQATRADVIAARTFLEEARFEDLVVVHLAGHGLLGADRTWRFATHDLDFGSARGGITFADLDELLDGLAAGSKVLLVDACHAGASSGRSWDDVGAGENGRGFVRVRTDEPSAGAASTFDPARIAELFTDLPRGTGATVIAGAAREEYAFEGVASSNGVFSHAILQTLRDGTGARPEGELWVADFVRSVRDRVAALTHDRQRPNLREGNPAFRRPLLGSPPIRSLYAPEKPFPVAGFALAPDGTRLALLSESQVRVVSTKDGAELVATPLPVEAATKACDSRSCRIAFSLDGQTLLLEAHQIVAAFHLAERGWRSLLPEDVHLSNARLSPDGRRMLASRPGIGDVLIDLTGGSGRLEPVPVSLRACVWLEAARLRCLDDRRSAVVDWDSARGETKERRTWTPAEPDQAMDSWLTEDGRFLLRRSGTIEEIAGVGGGGELSALEVNSGRSIRLTTASSILLSEARPTLAHLQGFIGPCAAPTPIIDASGSRRSTAWSRYGVGRAVAGGELVLRSDVIIASRDVNGFCAPDPERRASFFQMFDARTGDPVGWFAVPLRSIALVTWTGPELLVIDTANGAVYNLALRI